MAGYQEFQVPYRDVDLNGEMFRAAYLFHAEEALAEFWRHRKPVVDDPFFTVSKLSLTFYQPLKLGEHVRMTVAVSKIGGRSAGFVVRMRRGKEDIAEVEIVWSSVDSATREPVALPEDLRDWLYKFLD
jgi:acyl-CoA thioester hydrolase